MCSNTITCAGNLRPQREASMIAAMTQSSDRESENIRRRALSELNRQRFKRTTVDAFGHQGNALGLSLIIRSWAKRIFGSGRGDSTPDPRIMIPCSDQLSYPATRPRGLIRPISRPRGTLTSPAILFSTVCFRSQQNHAPPPTMTAHGRKQGNGGTLEAAEAINSYGLFEAARVKSPAAFFLSATRH